MDKINLLSMAERDQDVFAAYIEQSGWKKLSPEAQKALVRLAANYREMIKALKATKKLLDGCYGMMMQPYYDEAQQWRIHSVSPMEYSQARVRLANEYNEVDHLYYRDTVSCVSCLKELDEESIDVYRMRGKRMCLDCLFEREVGNII